jgi:1,4-dihydroxy-6-naphthoate synthase
MDPEVMRQHIALYVNEYSLDVGEQGERAIDTLLRLSPAPS